MGVLDHLLPNPALDTDVRAVELRSQILSLAADYVRLVRTVLRLSREKDELRIVDDQVGSPTFTEDVVHQLWTTIEDGCPGTYHCVNAGQASWHAFATRIVHRLGLNVPVIAIHTVDYPAPARRPVYSVLANRKFELEQLNGMRPWEDALDDCLLRYHEVLSHD